MGRREIEEMIQIEKGLEAFLQQELQEDDPEDFIENTDEDREREIDVIGASGEDRNRGSRSTSGRRNMLKEDYIEDWDNPRRRSSGGSRSTDGRSTGSKGSSTQRTSIASRNGSSSASRKTSTKAQGTQRSRRREDDYYEEDYDRRGRRQGNQKKRRKNKRFRRLKQLLVVVLVLLVLGALGLYRLVGSVYDKMNFREITSVADAPYREDGVINILLIGNDSRENGEDGRSDAMILLSISSRTKQIYMTSLLRDMYVEIPGHDGNRLNAAYSYGGAELLMETIEKNLDISVNRYVLVNFEAFANLVDAVGGVDLELSTAEIEYVNGYLVEYNMLTNRPQGTDNMDTSVSGMVHLNGPQALAYTRNRYLGTDFGRTERQRKVLSAVIKKLPLAMATNPGELIDGLMPNLTTNLTQWECYLLSFQAGKLMTYDIVQSSIPIAGSYHDATIRGMSVLEVDFDINRQYLKENIYGQTR